VARRRGRGLCRAGSGIRARDQPNHGGKSSASLIILPIVLAVLIATQWGAISLARRNTAAPLDH
jgi:hypothetical protein